MKKLLLFTTLLLAFACSKDDGENQTFLQKYDGYGFVAEYDLDSEYHFFSDSEYFLKYAYLFPDGDSECALIREGVDSEEGYDISILTNEGDTLLIEVEYTYTDGEEEVEQLEYSINSQGDVMTLTYIYDSERSDTDTTTYYRTSETYSDLCN